LPQLAASSAKSTSDTGRARQQRGANDTAGIRK
jgi:hypothetical protein